MKSMRWGVVGAAALAAAGIAGSAALEAGSQAPVLKIDPQHSHVGFRVRHIFTNVSGSFREFEGSLRFDEKNPAASSVDVTIKAASIDTNVEPRDKDLRSPRFFDVEKYPTITFKSSAIEPISEKQAKIKGILTMHGVSKEVVLDAEYLGKLKDPWGNLRSGFHAETRIDRRDYGLNWNEVLEAGAVLVGEQVEILLDVEGMPAR
jgi:polyisoprenoid-binding protein YceI